MMASAHHDPNPEILELVNKARLESRMAPLDKLPLGIPETSRQCVLGRSLEIEVLLDDYEGPFALVQQYRRACTLARVWRVGRPRAVWNDWAIALPAELSQFIGEFDARHYPQLVADQAATKPHPFVPSGARFDLIGLRKRRESTTCSYVRA